MSIHWHLWLILLAGLRTIAVNLAQPAYVSDLSLATTLIKSVANFCLQGDQVDITVSYPIPFIWRTIGKRISLSS